MSESLIVWARGIAEKARLSEMVEQAEQAVALLRGRVVASEDDAAQVTDLVKRVKAGAKFVKAALDEVVKPLREAADAARGELATLQSTLSEAEEEGKKSLGAWLQEKQRISREEEANRRREQEETERAAREAAAKGVEIPPPAEEPSPPPPARVTKGNVGASFTTSRVTAEMVDGHAALEFDPAWLRLDERAACDAFRAAEKNGLLDGGELSEGGTVWHGVLFKRTHSVAIR